MKTFVDLLRWYKFSCHLPNFPKPSIELSIIFVRVCLSSIRWSQPTTIHALTHVYVFTSAHPHFICWLNSVLAFFIHSILFSPPLLYFTMSAWLYGSRFAFPAHPLLTYATHSWFFGAFLFISPHTQTNTIFFSRRIIKPRIGRRGSINY